MAPPRRFDHDRAKRQRASGESVRSIARSLGVTRMAVLQAVSDTAHEQNRKQQIRWRQRQRLKRDALELAETDDQADASFQAMLLLIAAVEVGVGFRDLLMTTQLPREVVEEMRGRLFANGVWEQDAGGSVFRVEWLDPEQSPSETHIALILDALVAKGEVVRVAPLDQHPPVYRLVPS